MPIKKLHTLGFYSCIVPSLPSIITIRSLLLNAPWPTVSGNELHCSLCYSPVMPKLIEDYINECQKIKIPIQGTLTGLQYWPDAGEPTVGAIVCTVSSPDIVQAYEFWRSLGMENTHPDFKPHVTVGVDVTINQEIKNYIEDFNAALTKHPVSVVFEKVLIDFLRKD